METCSFDLTEASNKVKSLVKNLGWEKYHNPIDLCSAILLEASEVLGKLQWKTYDEKNDIFHELDKHRDILYEFADIGINLLSICNILNMDLNKIIVEKCDMIENRFISKISVSKGTHGNDLKCKNCNEEIQMYWKYCPYCSIEI